MNIELNQKPQLNKHDVISRFNLLERKLEFKKILANFCLGLNMKNAELIMIFILIILQCLYILEKETKAL